MAGRDLEQEEDAMGGASSEEEPGRGNGGWECGDGEEGVIAGREWRADGCKGIYCERVQRYCSGSKQRERERESKHLYQVTYTVTGATLPVR